MKVNAAIAGVRTGVQIHFPIGKPSLLQRLLRGTRTATDHLKDLHNCRALSIAIATAIPKDVISSNAPLSIGWPR
jgi:hypothetical protein